MAQFYIDREAFFDEVRDSLFGGSLDQGQVDGMNAILDEMERRQLGDNRWVGYILASTLHETATAMWPVEEYQGAQQPYGQVDPTTGQRYYGRGFIQITHRENYARADRELGLSGEASCEWHADNALDLNIASEIIYQGLIEGWFRSDSKGPHTLERYFHDDVDDPYNARECVNGDKSYVPSWSNGIPIGNLIADYYMDFTAALNRAKREGEAPMPPEPDEDDYDTVTTLTIFSTGPVRVVMHSSAENDHAIKITGAGESDEGGGARQGLRQEGRGPAKRG